MKTNTILLTAISFFVAASVSATMDDTRLKERLVHYFYADESIPQAEINGIKERLGVTDEQFHRVLMGIYREAEEKWPTLTPKTAEWYENRKIVACVIGWLPQCGDIPVKEFLLDYAASKEKNSLIRSGAVLSYLRVADAEEAKAALIRFLIGEEKMDDMMRMSLYQYAQMAWHEAPSMKKKAAILAALYVALSAESPPWVFRVGDQIVREMSPRYANSKERLALLERALVYPFPERRERTIRELKERLETMRKLKTYTSVNTNLAALKAHNFDQVSAEDGWADLTIPPPTAPAVATAAKGEPTRSCRRIGLYALGGAAVLILAVAGVWRFRWRGVSQP